MSQLSEQVHNYLSRRQDRSPATKEQYRWVLETIFLPWCAQAGYEGTDQLTDVAMAAFTSDLKSRTHPLTGRPLSTATIRTYIRTSRMFLNWSKVPLGDYRPPKQPHRLLDVLSRQEIDRMEQAALDERDRLIVRVLADCGLRISELLGLRVEDLRENTHDRQFSIRVIGKGDRQRDVPLPQQVFRRLKNYAANGRPSSDSPYIFLGKRRRPSGEVERLTSSGVDQLIRHIASKAEIGRRVYPHLFRHSYATHLLSQGVSPVKVQKNMGHTSLAMIVGTYSHLVLTDVWQDTIDALYSRETAAKAR